MSLPDVPRILEIGAGVKTPIELLGFALAGLFIILLVYKPRGSRAAGTAASWRRLRFITGLGAGVFLLALAIVSFAPSRTLRPAPLPRQNPADEHVDDCVRKFYIMDSIFEARDPGWPEQVRREGERLADLLDRENRNELRTTRKILQAEYRGWALSMVARSFVEEKIPEAEKKRSRIEFATIAVQEFDRAIEIMGDVTYRKRQPGDRDAIDAYNWMMGLTDPPSDDFKRIHYLKAVSIAVIAQAGGSCTKQDVRNELKNIPAEYYLIDHPNNPDLNWALQD
jgi:hypothetical protein